MVADKDAVLLKPRLLVLLGRLPLAAMLVTVVEAPGAVEITEAVEDAENRDTVSVIALSRGKTAVDKVTRFDESFDVKELPLDRVCAAKLDVTLPKDPPCRVEFKVALAVLPLRLAAPEVGEVESASLVG